MSDQPSQPIPTEFAVSFGDIDYSKANVGRFYANHVNVSLSLFEIRMILADVDVDNASRKLVAQSLYTVMLNPSLARLLHQLLGKAIESYLQMFGELPKLPPANIKQPEGTSGGHPKNTEGV